MLRIPSRRRTWSNQSNHRNSFANNFCQSSSKGFQVGDEDLSADDLIVAVMGPTGSGKSSFIELATGVVGIAGHGLQSFTSKISVVKLAYPGVNLCFVDTPGFDDTNTSDLDIFKMISNWLVKTYRKQIRLTGLLYFHRISDVRVAGTSLKNLRLFEKLCGEHFNNIVFTTTMWDEVDESVGIDRELELRNDFWSPMIKRGASIQRFLNTQESAFEILLPVFNKVNERSARALLLQSEMNDRGLLLKETSAGKTLYMELGELVARHHEVLGEIRRDLKDPTADPDQLRLLMEDYQRASMQLQRASQDMVKMKSTRDRIHLVIIPVDWTKFVSIPLFSKRIKKEIEPWQEEQKYSMETQRMWLEAQSDRRWAEEQDSEVSTSIEVVDCWKGPKTAAVAVVGAETGEADTAAPKGTSGYGNGGWQWGSNLGIWIDKRRRTIP